VDPKLLDARIRQAAFDAVSQMAFSRGGNLESGDLRYGFVFDGERLPLINPQRGIFKPRQMGWLLSIRTVFPRSGARVWYDDQHEAHRQIYAGNETIEYAFMGADPSAADNRWLREAMEEQIPSSTFSAARPENTSRLSRHSWSDGISAVSGHS
jgi:putative restriction endonuclease